MPVRKLAMASPPAVGVLQSLLGSVVWEVEKQSNPNCPPGHPGCAKLMRCRRPSAPNLNSCLPCTQSIEPKSVCVSCPSLMMLNVWVPILFETPAYCPRLMAGYCLNPERFIYEGNPRSATGSNFGKSPVMPELFTE